MKFLVLFFFSLLSALPAGAQTTELHVGSFSTGDLNGWKPKSFKGTTTYTLVKDGDRTVLKGEAHNAGSGLFKKIKLSVREYPILRWSWKVDHLLKKENVKTKEGDDFPARVYAVFAKTFFWQTKALIYVWSTHMTKGTAVPNPYSSNAMLIAVEAGPEKLGTWVTEERNIYDDYRKYFNEEPPQLGAVAVMTDTDNTGENAAAWYGDVFLAPATK